MKKSRRNYEQILVSSFLNNSGKYNLIVIYKKNRYTKKYISISFNATSMLTIITNIFVYIAFPIIVGITIVIFQKTFESYEIDMKKVITKIKNPL